MLKMLCSQHHITIKELSEALEIYKMNIKDEHIVLQPDFNSTTARAGTPITCNKI
jgi:hypothetical protein